MGTDIKFDVRFTGTKTIRQEVTGTLSISREKLHEMAIKAYGETLAEALATEAYDVEVYGSQVAITLMVDMDADGQMLEEALDDPGYGIRVYGVEVGEGYGWEDIENVEIFREGTA